MVVRIQIQNRQADDIELISHVNETIGSLRRQIYIKTKLNPQVNKIDLIINNECIECIEDNKILGDYLLKEKIEKMFIIARITQSTHHHHHQQSSSGGGLNLNLAASSSSAAATTGSANTTGNRLDSSGGEDDSSSSSTTDECTSSQDNETGGPGGANHAHHVVGSPNLDYELQLPSMILSLSEQYVQFLIDLADFACRIRNAQIKEFTRAILDLLPIAKHTGEKIKLLCKESAQKQQQQQQVTNNSPMGEVALENFYTNCTQTQCWYNLKVTHALLLPAMYQYNPEETKQFQVGFCFTHYITL